MKIAVIDPSLFTWPYDKAIVESLLDLGNDVNLYTKHLAEEDEGSRAFYVRQIFYPYLEANLLKRLPNSLFLCIKGFSHIFGMVTLWLALKKFAPDIIHFQWAALPFVDRFFVSVFRSIAPVILTVHDSSPFNSSPTSRLQSMGAISILGRFDQLIVHTQKAKKAIQQYGIGQSKISRIEHGVLGDKFPSVALVNDPDRPVTFLLFGYLKPYKGADLIISALSKMPADAQKRALVWIVGKPLMDTRPLKALAEDLNVQGRLRWDLRFVSEEEVGAIFSASDVIAMPYREIDASGVLMVSVSAGRPILASEKGLFAELLEDGVHGRLFPVADVEALAEAMTSLVKDVELRQQMGINVRALAATIPSWKDIARKTVALYERTIESSDARLSKTA